jgi:hypothetical protein
MWKRPPEMTKADLRPRVCVSEETKRRDYLTNYTETSVEAGRQLSREPYLYGVLGLVAVVVLVVGLLLLFA